jgi:hypothetical protein
MAADRAAARASSRPRDWAWAVAELAAGGHAVVAEGVEVRPAAVDRREVPAEARLAEAADQRHGGAAVPEAACVGLRAGVDVEAVLEPEAGAHAAAEVFGAAHAQAAGVDAAAGQRADRVAAVFHLPQAGIDDAEQRDGGGLRLHRRGRCSGEREEDEWLFHEGFLVARVEPSGGCRGGVLAD